MSDLCRYLKIFLFVVFNLPPVVGCINKFFGQFSTRGNKLGRFEKGKKYVHTMLELIGLFSLQFVQPPMVGFKLHFTEKVSINRKILYFFIFQNGLAYSLQWKIIL